MTPPQPLGGGYWTLDRQNRITAVTVVNEERYGVGRVHRANVTEHRHRVDAKQQRVEQGERRGDQAEAERRLKLCITKLIVV
jgi:hypothetical protein